MPDSEKPAPVGERRGHFRGRSGPGRRVDVSYSRQDGSACANGESTVRAVTGNIGVGGAFVLSPHPEPLSTALQIELSVPPEPLPLLLRGTVRWIQDDSADTSGMGIKFDALSVDELLALRDYFSTL